MLQGPQNRAQQQAQPHHNFIIQPDNFTYRCWQHFLVFLAFYLCFISSMLGTFTAPRPRPLYLTITNIVVSLFFGVDIFLSFRVAYRDKKTFAMVNDRTKIAKETVKTVALHIVLCVPFELVATLFCPSSFGDHMVSLVALLRFFYAIRIHRWFSELEKNENINFIVVRITKMIWICLLICHYGGCVFYLMATFHADVGTTWISLFNKDSNFINRGLIEKYVSSMYYSVISFTTVGYGDLHPVSRYEQVFSVIFVLVDFALVTYVATTIVLLVVPDAGPLGKYRARRVRVLGFCRQNGLPDELCDEVSSYLKLEYLSKSQPSEENDILESLPTTVKRKILIALSNIVTHNNLFKHLSNSIQLQLIQAMEPVFFPANTSIILQNEAPIFLYFVVRGSVDLKFSSGFVKTVRDGEVFGETCVFFNTSQVFSAKTREWSRFLVLDRVRLINILQGSPSDTSRMICAHIEDLSANDINPYMNAVLYFEKRARIGMIDLPVSLWFAVSRGYNMLFDLLIVEEGVDPNGCDNFGRTAMHLAASMGDVDKVNRLFEIGVDPNLKDFRGNVPLWNAMLGGHANVVDMLETNGCTLEGCPVGYYACTAASADNMDALQALGHRDNQFLSIPNNHGRTALHVAVVRDNFVMVEYLVENGVSIDENDNDGDSAYALATRYGLDQIVNYLEFMLLQQLN